MFKHPRSKYGLIILIATVFILSIYSFSFATNNNDDAITLPVNGEVTRTISPDEDWVQSTFTLTYSLNLENILSQVKGPKKNGQKGPSLNSYKLIQWNVKIVEKIPKEFTVPDDIDLPKGFAFNKNTRELTGEFSLECAKKNGSNENKCNKVLKNESLTSDFSIPLIATTPGTFTFDTGKYAYSFYAEHSGKGTTKHDRDINGSPGTFSPEIVTVKGTTLTVPNTLTLYVGEGASTNVDATGTIDSSQVKWESDNNGIVGLQSNGTTVSITPKMVGETLIRATYTYPNGYVVKSNNLKVMVKLPDLALNPKPNELWVYQDAEGTLIKQSVTITLDQTKLDGSKLSGPLEVDWTSSSTALSVSETGVNVATVRAEHGSQGGVTILGELTDYPGQSKRTLIDVKEYPQLISTPNVILYMSDSPYSYGKQITFYPDTANVTGYGLTVLEGTDVLRIEQGELKLLKPGLAKVGLVTQDVSASFPNGGGPEPISQYFYVQVKDGTDPNPGIDTPAGDFY
ncbi:hypothetical protein ACFQO8_09395 [Exiguobacterium aestuarii]|uniref:Uncharacterized protein n=1 Tax=Exiguobacterium aestuarii TaxID=273527 RepID=A0ABW2PLN5_9BACL|nr:MULTISPECIES: hypothetical protein [Exiguobacterium]MCT4785241.1 hypothetical protein [Exiguobacterium aestuarii]